MDQTKSLYACHEATLADFTVKWERQGYREPVDLKTVQNAQKNGKTGCDFWSATGGNMLAKQCITVYNYGNALLRKLEF